MRQTIAMILMILGLSLVVLGLIVGSVDRSEKVECRKWQEYSAQYAGFYLVQWQKDQCDHHEIIINSPVK